jgi:hypothetical protein
MEPPAGGLMIIAAPEGRKRSNTVAEAVVPPNLMYTSVLVVKSRLAPFVVAVAAAAAVATAIF